MKLFEALESRIVLTSVWDVDPSGSVLDGNITPGSAVLEDGTLATAVSLGDRTTVQFTSGDHSTSGRTLGHEILEIRFEPDGDYTATGTFLAGEVRDKGVGVFTRNAAQPTAVLVEDLEIPIASTGGGGLSAPGAFTARIDVHIVDNLMLSRESIGADSFAVEFEGATLPVTIVSLDMGPDPTFEIIVTLEFPVLGEGYHTVSVVDDGIRDFAGNPAEEIEIGGLYILEDENGMPTGPVWSEPSPPSEFPARPWAVTPWRGQLTMLVPQGFAAQRAHDGTVYFSGVLHEDGGPLGLGLGTWDGHSSEADTFDITDMHPLQLTAGGRVLGVSFSSFGPSEPAALWMWDGPGAASVRIVEAEGNGFSSFSNARLDADGRVLVYIERGIATASLKIAEQGRSDEWFPQTIYEPDPDTSDLMPFLNLAVFPELPAHTPASGHRAYTVVYDATGFDASRFVTRSAVMALSVHLGPVAGATNVSGVQVATGMEPEVIALSEVGFASSGTRSYTGLLAGAERAEAADEVIAGDFIVLSLFHQHHHEGFEIGLYGITESQRTSAARAEWLGLRPVLVLPGIFATFPLLDQYWIGGTVPDLALGQNYSNWLTNRGHHPSLLEVEPAGGTYEVLLRTLDAPEAGYVRFDPRSPNSRADLYPAAYDWRVPPAPVHERPTTNQDEPWQRVYDGVITGLGNLTDTTFAHGVDYLAYWAKKAKDDWSTRHPGHELTSVDVYGHSTGGIVARSYIQSDQYGEQGIPTVNRFVSMAVPHRGASKAWNLLHNDFSTDPFYEYGIAGIANGAFQKVLNGESITGPDGPITLARLERAVDTNPNFRNISEAFINLYVSTGRALLATYDFLVEGNGIIDVNATPQANGIVLDLNNGLDLDPSMHPKGTSASDYRSRFQEYLFAGNDPVEYRDVLDPLTSRSSVSAFYSHSWSEGGVRTLHYVEPQAAPARHEPIFGLAPSDIAPTTPQVVTTGWRMLDTAPLVGRVTPPDYINTYPELWWKDRETYNFVTPTGGDGTVPGLSGGGLFENHPDVRHYETTNPAIDHNEINGYAPAMRDVMRELNIPSQRVVPRDPSGAASHLFGQLQSVLNLNIGETAFDILSFHVDPVEAFVIDAEGRRTGWSEETGPLSEIPGSFYMGGADGFGLLPAPADGSDLRIQLTGVEDMHHVQLISPDPDSGYNFTSTGAIGVGEARTVRLAADARPSVFNDGAGGPLLREGDEPDRAHPGDAFIERFSQLAEGGLAQGDAIVDELLERVPDAAHFVADWTAENYWFQASNGDVWSLWHGGFVHQLPDGQHQWVLTNLAEAAGLSGSVSIAQGSISGLITGWRAFSIQGIVDGELQSLWWSPEGSAGTYTDGRGNVLQGRGLGINGNGWVLSSITQALIDPETGQSASRPALRPFTESQANGRTSFNPAPARAEDNNGMSVVVVDESDRVWVATYSIWQHGDLAEARADLDTQWVLEPFDTVPGLVLHNLTGSAETYADAYRSAARG